MLSVACKFSLEWIERRLGSVELRTNTRIMSSDELKSREEKITKQLAQAVKGLDWVKIVVIGGPRTGKTCLIKCFCESQFTKYHEETVGVDYGFKLYNNGCKDLRLTFWDLGGHRSYAQIRKELYGRTDKCSNFAVILLNNVIAVCCLVYDVTSVPSTVAYFDDWKSELRSFGGKDAKVVVIGNKIDLSHKKAAISDVTKWAADQGFPHFLTSAATGSGVGDMFQSVLGASL